MKKGNSLKAVFLTALLTVLVSCAGSQGMKIGNTVTLCCPGDYATYKSYGIEAVTLPLFLRDYAVAQFDTAFQEKGLARNDQRSELIVNLAYRHVNLNPDQQTIDPFIRMESMNVELDYIAAIDITIRERSGGKVVWGGTVSRLHSVQPGEYMHQGAATAAFLETFRDVLSEYPATGE
jgi:hypothetical protein